MLNNLCKPSHIRFVQDVSETFTILIGDIPTEKMIMPAPLSSEWKPLGAKNITRYKTICRWNSLSGWIGWQTPAQSQYIEWRAKEARSDDKFRQNKKHGNCERKGNLRTEDGRWECAAGNCF